MSEVESTGKHDRVHQLMMGALDGELSPAERSELDRLLAADSSLQEEWQRLQKVKEVTHTMALRTPPEEVWDTYWSSVYARVERGIGWILLSLGAIVLISYGLWSAAKQLLADTSIPPFIKAAVFVLTVGMVILFVSIVREKWFVYRSDPYKDIQR